MPTRRYSAIEVQQQPGAPLMYLLSVPAAELLEWCDIPRTKEDYMAGYQRTLTSDRTTEIADYLRKSPENVLPGAVIVAADKEYVKVVKDGRNTFIDVEDDPRTTKQKIEELFGSFSTRLSTEEMKSAKIEVFEQEQEGEEEEDESEYPTSYLAALAQELNVALQDWDNIDAGRRKAIEDYIGGVSKPGLIIDGQHRVVGAKNVSGHDVILPVVLMYDLPHQEQVFQFYVLNNKAKPLKPTELRRTISTSLTNAEIEKLYGRFSAAGIDAHEARWTFEANTSPKSVFKDLIDFGFGKSGTIIPENVADQLVRGFMKMPSGRYAALINPVKAKRWDDPKERLQIFFDFWKAISEVYDVVWKQAVADAKSAPPKQHQLFKKVGLLTLQRFLLDRFVTALPYRGDTAAPPFENSAATKEMVESTLKFLPSQFFSKEWKVPQMDTSEGRKLLYDEMAKVWDNQGKIHGNQRLFKG